MDGLHKHCPDCKKTKAASEFYAKQSYCKDCCKARARSWQKENPQAHQRNVRKYKKSLGSTERSSANERHNELRRNRYHTDPEYRAQVMRVKKPKIEVIDLRKLRRPPEPEEPV